MKCIVCRRASGFRFCSDACFLSWAPSRVGVECAVCQYDAAAGRIGNPSTNKLCDDCRGAEENDGWVENSAVSEFAGSINSDDQEARG